MYIKFFRGLFAHLQLVHAKAFSVVGCLMFVSDETPVSYFGKHFPSNDIACETATLNVTKALVKMFTG